MSGTGSRRVRALALGYQGWGNLGDEAVLTGIEALLRGSGVEVAAIASGPRPETIVAFPAARRVAVPRLVPTVAALRALRRSDGLLLAGGGLIHDHWWSVVPRYLAWIIAARALGRRVVWLGVGVGPLRRRPIRWVARLAARLSTLVLVRDDTSAALLGRVGTVRVIPDPALFNAAPAARQRDGLAVIVRAPVRAGDAELRDSAARIATLVGDLAAAGHTTAVLTMAGPADAALGAALAAAGHPTEALGATPEDALQRLAGFEAAVSVRLHGLLLSVVAGTPCVAVAYDAKVRAAAEALGTGDLVIEHDQLDARRALPALAAAASPERRDAVADRLTAIRAVGGGIGEAVSAALREGRR